MNTVERWEFTRWSGNSPDAVKNAAMEVARLVYYRQREWPRREWGDIGQLETYSIAQLAKVIYPVLRDAWPQAQAEQPEAGREYECAECDVALEKRNQFRYSHPHNGCRLAGSWAIGEIHDVRKGGDETIIRLARTSRQQTQEAAAIGWLRLHDGQPDWDECCIFTTLEDAERYLDSCNLDPEERQEYSHAQIYLAPPANAEAVRWLSRDDARLALFQAIKAIKIGNKTDDKLILDELQKRGFWLAQHGGRG